MKFKVGKELQEEGIAYNENEKCPCCKGKLIPKNKEVYYMHTPTLCGFTKDSRFYNFWECLHCGKRYEVKKIKRGNKE